MVAYGTAARIAESAIEELQEEGLRAGLFRPITLWPFPLKPLRELSREVPKVAVFELSLGQMVEDVILSVGETNLGFIGLGSTPGEQLHVGLVVGAREVGRGHFVDRFIDNLFT